MSNLKLPLRVIKRMLINSKINEEYYEIVIEDADGKLLNNHDYVIDGNVKTLLTEKV